MTDSLKQECDRALDSPQAEPVALERITTVHATGRLRRAKRTIGARVSARCRVPRKLPQLRSALHALTMHVPLISLRLAGF